MIDYGIVAGGRKKVRKWEEMKESLMMVGTVVDGSIWLMFDGSINSGWCPAVGFLDRVVVLFLVFKGHSIPFSIMVCITIKRCPLHHRGLECKSRKSRDTWSNSQVWPWSTKWSKAKVNRVWLRDTLVIANTLFQQHKRCLYTWVSLDGQHQNQIEYILCSQDGEAL